MNISNAKSERHSVLVLGNHFCFPRYYSALSNMKLQMEEAFEVFFTADSPSTDAPN